MHIPAVLYDLETVIRLEAIFDVGYVYPHQILILNALSAKLKVLSYPLDHIVS